MTETAGSTTWERLLPVAASLFRERGYAATSTRELAAHLDLNKASLYHYIDNKEVLLYRICQESLTRVIEATDVAIASEVDSLARLRAAIRAHMVSMLNDIDMHATMLLELRSLAADRHKEIRQLRDTHEAQLVGVLRDAQRDGKVRADIDETDLAAALFNLMNWTIIWYQPKPDRPEALAELWTTMFLEGALPR